MKFVLAPDSFKESMTSIEACDAMERAIKKIFKDAECIKVPMADGGEGTTYALVNATGGEFIKKKVHDPLNREIIATYGILGDKETAVLEMAEASGIQLVKKEERNPLKTTTYGTGELILDALDKGIKKIVIGIGGSATNDGGAGMLQALGAKLLDSEGKEIGFGGGELHKLQKIDFTSLDARVLNASIQVACDVTNPLTGPTGASYIFGPQKGADKDTVEILDKNLENFAKIVERDLKISISNREGAGAAGGLGGALILLDGELKKGIELVIEHTGLKEKVKNADYVFTGEGSIDGQTIYGKTPFGVLNVANEEGAKTIAFAGRVEDGAENLYEINMHAMFSIMTEVCTLKEALENGAKNLEKTCENVLRILK